MVKNSGNMQLLPPGVPAEYAINKQFSEKDQARIDFITKLVAGTFRGFGGGMVNEYNPISHALKDNAPSFAMGVDMKEVVTFVVDHYSGMLAASMEEMKEAFEKELTNNPRILNREPDAEEES